MAYPESWKSLPNSSFVNTNIVVNKVQMADFVSIEKKETCLTKIESKVMP